MKTQLTKYSDSELKITLLQKIERTEAGFKIFCENNTFEAKDVVLATGMHKFDIEVNEVEVKREYFCTKTK